MIKSTPLDELRAAIELEIGTPVRIEDATNRVGINVIQGFYRRVEDSYPADDRIKAVAHDIVVRLREAEMSPSHAFFAERCGIEQMSIESFARAIFEIGQLFPEFRGQTFMLSALVERVKKLAEESR